MHTKLMLSAALALALATPCLADQPTASQADIAGVAQATAEFYSSLNALFTGDAEPMSRHWSHADDVTYMGPAGGFQIGWDQVYAVWQQQAALKLGGKIRPDNVHTIVSGNLAVVHCVEVGDNMHAGKPVQVSIRATNIYRQENGEWKMIGHHTDLLPFLEQ